MADTAEKKAPDTGETSGTTKKRTSRKSTAAGSSKKSARGKSTRKSSASKGTASKKSTSTPESSGEALVADRPGRTELDLNELYRVLDAVRRGDFSVRMPDGVDGVGGKIVDTLNEIISTNREMVEEIERASRLVGVEGKISRRLQLEARGEWRDGIEAVNDLISNLAQPTAEVSRVIGAVAKGDLSPRMSLDNENGPLQGDFLRTAKVVNTMVDRLASFASEVTRVAREVGTEGKLGGQAKVRGVSGTWKDLTDNVNSMANNLTSQVRNIAEVTTAVARGDLSKKITVDVRGEILELKDTINTMVDQLSSFASEVTRVAREVGTEGKLGGQAQVRGVSGVWKDLTDNVNSMADNLTTQVRNIAEVTTSVANGDLSRKITVDVKGEILELKNTINTMVDQLSSFASEVTRMAREVGTEGKLGGQAKVKEVSGIWKDLTENVNSMANNLTAQVRNIAEVTTAVARGDLSKKITVDVRGEMAELKNTINTMVDQLSSFASEVTRVAREVGSEGKLGGQAEVKGVSGTWKDLTDNVNSMADNLTAQVRNIAEVTTAVANGDLSRKITVNVKGEILELKNTINTMVDQLNSFASEVTRVAREVGSEGKLGGQAEVKGVSGTWKDLTDNVNSMGDNLTAQVRNIAEVTTAVARGDLSKKITVDVKGEIAELKNTINTMVDQLSSFASEVTRVAREVGTEGKLGGQAEVKGVSGTWKDLTDNVNSMADNLTAQVRNIAEVTTAVANGDLSRKITVNVKGEILELKNTINTMVDQLNSFASEVTRVAREVGTEGKLGGQAEVKGVSGTWKDLTDNVNSMAGNLTAQVRGIARVVTAVARGDLKQKLSVEAKGEIAELAGTINNMIDTLATFADQVTTVAREVGIEGKLGGQANVPGASGTWRDLTDNVNWLAANLTTQVRAITEVTTAVADGDLSKKITVEAAGEVADLKDNVNEMIRNLKDTTRVNAEQDWLKTNLTKLTRLLQGQKDLVTVSKVVLSELAPLVEMQHGVFYVADGKGKDLCLKLFGSYAYRERKELASEFALGEGLVGQCALEKERILISNVPPDYININSGLGAGPPLHIVVLPIIFEGELKGVIELASFAKFSQNSLTFLDQLTESIGIVLNTIEANMRTETLLEQSQSLTGELQSQQEELQEKNRRLEEQAASLQASEELMKTQQEKLQATNAELEEKAQLLSMQKAEVERKNRELDLARRAIEEKADQLALTSRYKSEFLANMSHELRTPLNSMLILSKMLAENPEDRLTQKQVEFAETIYSSGSDLLTLINEILDHSKIESGTVGANIERVDLSEIVEDLHRMFAQVAEGSDLDFTIELAEDLPETMETDSKRLLQILKNLLANAFKFTEEGAVGLMIGNPPEGKTYNTLPLTNAERVVSFAVSDTGIGIPTDQQGVIFEAFQQADGTASRQYGGTGLGLSISREIARLLGGEIHLTSRQGEGSTFTLFLPLSYHPGNEGDNLADVIRRDSPEQGNGDAHEPGRLEEAVSGNSNGQAQLPPASGDRSRPPTSAEDQTGGEGNDEEGDAFVPDDRNTIEKGDRVLLVVEDDAAFARIIVDKARQKGFKVIVTPRGENAISLARRYRPDAITLDIKLPGMSGLTLLDRLKHDSATRHIPVNILSVIDEIPRNRRMGAISYVQKPVTQESIEAAINSIRGFVDRSTKNLLVVEDDEKQRGSIADMLAGDDLNLVAVGTGAEALVALKEAEFDCLVLDLGLPDTSGLDLISTIRKSLNLKDLPIVVYTGRELGEKEAMELHRMAEAVIVKDVQSIDRLLDETSLFLHRATSSLPEKKREIIMNQNRGTESLTDRKILIVDDDIRNIFALTSLLERHGMKVFYAENGKDGLEFLKKNSDVDAVLMDVMMPEMDGYETTRAIREVEDLQDLPVIAVTAKAMKGDREKCIEAGASDYLTKPVDIEQLLSLLRVWIPAVEEEEEES